MTGRRPRQSGFTLVELLVVLAIIGLLLSLVPVAFDRVLPGLELDSTTRDLAAALRQARSRSIRDNRDIALILDLDGRRYQVEGVGRVHEIDEAIEIRLLTAAEELEGEGRGRIRFFPDGTSTGGRVTLSAAGASRTVEVDWLSGRVATGTKPQE